MLEILQKSHAYKKRQETMPAEIRVTKKVWEFLKKNRTMSDCIVLDELNGNDYVNKISDKWSGAIPATLFINKGKKILVEKKMTLSNLLHYQLIFVTCSIKHLGEIN